MPQGDLTAFALPILLDAERRREAYDNRDCPDGLIDDLAFVGALAARVPLRFGSAIAAVASDRMRRRRARSR